MEYFEIRDRLRNLRRFRAMYKEYLAFTNRERNPAAQLVLEKMEPMVRLTVDSLRRVKLGSMITRDAPARGGRRVKINVIKAIFREKVKSYYSLDEEAPLRALDKGILLYQRRLWLHTVQLFNPLFWLYHFSGFLARLPILIVRRAGYDTDRAEKMLSIRMWIVVVQALCFYALFQWTGLVSGFLSLLLGPVCP
jgi:hypothetical protein